MYAGENANTGTNKATSPVGDVGNDMNRMFAGENVNTGTNKAK